jgi:hypothetical protein
VRPVGTAAGAALLLAGWACQPSGSQLAPAPVATAATEWPRIYAQAAIDAREARLPSADRALVAFAARFPSSADAAEVPYWRAVIKLDPAIPASGHEALLLLDASLADTSFRAHRLEATTLRNLEAALEQRTAALAAQPATPAVRPEDRARDEELAHLRDELAKANAELTRIKRRLTRQK